MKDTYQIILDEDILRRFIEDYCYPTKEDALTYYISLFARKKYLKEHPALTHDKTCLKRAVSVRERLVSKIKQMEVPVGSYTGKNELPIPQESLALYMTPTPRDLKKSAFGLMKTLLENLEKGEYVNPYRLSLDAIQVTSHTETAAQVFDIDSYNQSVLDFILRTVQDRCNVILTKGGYHVIVHRATIKKYSKDWSKTWYKDIANNADVTGDALSPIPGTYQAGFCPLHLKKYNYFADLS